MSRNKKILFLVPYPLKEAPSQRFRFEQYFEALDKNEICYEVSSFINKSTWDILYKPGHIFKKVSGIFSGFLHRFWILRKVTSYDFIFIHREASPIGPPMFEWVISKILKKKVIFDFDDAIWLPNTSENNKIVAAIKWHSKTASICQWSYKISCGNEYLKKYALNFNQNVVLNPTTIDTLNHHNQTINYDLDFPVMGWTGTHSTIKYLDKIIPVLDKLSKDHSFKFIVISNRKPEFDLKGLEYIPWNKSSEIEDLCKINIGIMPLEEDQWSEGKCGFKGLQYMSLGIATIMSPVGVNKSIIQDGINGFLAQDEKEWLRKLKELIEDKNLRKKLGQAGKQTIEKHFSVQRNEENFLALFQ